MLQALIGAGASVLGGALGGLSAPSMPKYRPADIITGMGTADWDKKGKNLTTTLSPEMQAFSNLYNQRAMQYLNGGGPTAPFQNFTNTTVQGMFPGLFQNALDSSGVDQASLNAYLSNLGGTASGMQGIFSSAAGAGMGALGGPLIGSGQANTMFGMGQGLMGVTPQSYNDVYSQRLGLLREQAAPFEQRAQDSFLNRMYSMGQMGDHTGGLRSTEAFARGLGQADTTRQLDAMNLSEALYGRDQSNALGLNSLGASLMGNGLQGLLSGYGQQGAFAQGMLGLGGSTGATLSNIFGSGFGAQQGFNELVNARSQQRMTNASQLFGFGNTLGQQDQANALGYQDQIAALNQALLNQGQMGMQSGATKMGAGPQGGNPVMGAIGAGLQGFGNGVLANPGMFGFGGGGYDPNAARMASGYQPVQGALSQPYTPIFQTPTYTGPIPQMVL